MTRKTQLVLILCLLVLAGVSVLVAARASGALAVLAVVLAVPACLGVAGVGMDFVTIAQDRPWDRHERTARRIKELEAWHDRWDQEHACHADAPFALVRLREPYRPPAPYPLCERKS